MAPLSDFSRGRSARDVLRFCSPVASFLFLWALGDFAGQLTWAADKGARADSKPAARAEDADAEQDIDLSGLVVPPELLAKSKEADRQKFSQELRGLLLEGFKGKEDGLNAAKKHYESARRLVVDDPRAPYAYGLVLVAQNRPSFALDQFRAAATHKGVPYLPAMQAIASVSVSRGDYARALPALLDLARQLEESQESWPSAEDKERSAEWLGRMVGFLDGPGRVAEQTATIDKLAADVVRILTAERKEACERGQKQVAGTFAQLQAIAVRPEAELLSEVKRQREEAAAAATAADREVKQLEGELRDLKKPHDKQLADLTREIHDNAMKVKTSSARLAGAEKEVEDLSSPKKHASYKYQGNRRPGMVVARDENKGEKKIRESQLSSAEKSRDYLQTAIDDAKQAITRAKQQREDVHAEFRKATAEKRQELLAVQHKAAELANRAREAKNGALTPESLKARVNQLDSYVPLYPDMEKARLLATLKPAT